MSVVSLMSSGSPAQPEASLLVHPSGGVMEWESVSFIEAKDEYMIVNVYS